MKVFEKENAFDLLKEALTKGYVSIENSVKQQGSIKRIRAVKVHDDPLVLAQLVSGISANRKKQKQLLLFMQQHIGATYIPDELCEQANVSMAVLW